MRTHRGASLVELLVVMSACSVILSMSAGLVHRAMRTHSQTRSVFEVERSALRLSGQFRRDVHRATSAITDDASLGEHVFVRLQLPGDQIVEYRRLQQSVMRIVSQSVQTVSREEFPWSSAIEVALQEENSPRRLVLSITAAPATAADGEQVSSPREMQVSFQAEANLGCDWRFAPDAASPGNAK